MSIVSNVVTSKEFKIKSKTYFEVDINVLSDDLLSLAYVRDSAWSTGASVDNPFGLLFQGGHVITHSDDISEDSTLDSSSSIQYWFGIGTEPFVKDGIEPHEILKPSVVYSKDITPITTTGSQYSSVDAILPHYVGVQNKEFIADTVHFGFEHKATTSGDRYLGRFYFEKVKMTENNYLKAIVGQC